MLWWIIIVGKDKYQTGLRYRWRERSHSLFYNRQRRSLADSKKSCYQKIMLGCSYACDIVAKTTVVKEIDYICIVCKFFIVHTVKIFCIKILAWPFTYLLLQLSECHTFWFHPCWCPLKELIHRQQQSKLQCPCICFSVSVSVHW